MNLLVLAAIAAAAGLGSAGSAPVVLPWSEAGVFEVVTHPGRVTDIALEPGEKLSGSAPVAAGDTARWILGDTESGPLGARIVHVLVKPTEVGLITNLVVLTDRRTYHLELRSTQGAFMPAVSWRYPVGDLIALRQTEPPATLAVSQKTPPAANRLADLHFGYRIEGAAPWRPQRVFDDGKEVVIDFPDRVAGSEMPPLFVLTEPGGTLQIASYRVLGRRMVVDHLFSEAELRIGTGRTLRRVRLVREP